MPNLPATTRSGLLASLAAQYSTALAAVDDGPHEQQGVAAGAATADAMIADRQDDGRFGASQWVPSTAVGHW